MALCVAMPKIDVLLPLTGGATEAGLTVQVMLGWEGAQVNAMAALKSKGEERVIDEEAVLPLARWPKREPA